MKKLTFKIDIPEEDIRDLKNRLNKSRWAAGLSGFDDEYGIELSRMQEIVRYWLDDFDWYKKQEELNRYPQFLAEIDNQRIHFVHIKSVVKEAMPIIITHGWPSTYTEFLPLVERLTDPEKYGGTPKDAFHVVIPSLPGFGFSGPTREQGWDRFRTAKAWAELMKELGYNRYIAAGNDVGSFVAPELGRVAHEHTAGVHVTQIFSFPGEDKEEMSKLSEKDFGKLEFLQNFMNNLGAFNTLQSTKPHTLAYALADSPIGQLAWNLQLFGRELPLDFILTNVTITWLTNTAASSARIYYEDAHSGNISNVPSEIPIGLASFAGDFQSIRPFAERDHKNIISWNEYDRGGHFPAITEPDLYIEDLRNFRELLG